MWWYFLHPAFQSNCYDYCPQYCDLLKSRAAISFVSASAAISFTNLFFARDQQVAERKKKFAGMKCLHKLLLIPLSKTNAVIGKKFFNRVMNTLLISERIDEVALLVHLNGHTLRENINRLSICFGKSETGMINFHVYPFVIADELRLLQDGLQTYLVKKSFWQNEELKFFFGKKLKSRILIKRIQVKPC